MARNSMKRLAASTQALSDLVFYSLADVEHKQGESLAKIKCGIADILNLVGGLDDVISTLNKKQTNLETNTKLYFEKCAERIRKNLEALEDEALERDIDTASFIEHVADVKRNTEKIADTMDLIFYRLNALGANQSSNIRSAVKDAIQAIKVTVNMSEVSAQIKELFSMSLDVVRSTTEKLVSLDKNQRGISACIGEITKFASLELSMLKDQIAAMGKIESDVTALQSDMREIKAMLHQLLAERSSRGALQSGAQNSAEMRSESENAERESDSAPIEPLMLPDVAKHAKPVPTASNRLMSYVAVDIETTGFSPSACEITELGALKVANGEVVDSFQSLIRIDGTVPYNITNITGITDEMLEAHGRPLADVMTEFVKFAAGLPLVAHNASFDMSFIKAAIAKCGMDVLCNEVIDTLRLARQAIKSIKSHKLVALVEHFRLNLKPYSKNSQAHRALVDSYATHLIYQKLMKMAGVPE